MVSLPGHDLGDLGYGVLEPLLEAGGSWSSRMGIGEGGHSPCGPRCPALTEGPLCHLVGIWQDTELSEQTPTSPPSSALRVGGEGHPGLDGARGGMWGVDAGNHMEGGGRAGSRGSPGPWAQPLPLPGRAGSLGTEPWIEVPHIRAPGYTSRAGKGDTFT